MFKTLLWTSVLVAISLSAVSKAQAGVKSFDRDVPRVSGTDLGSGR